MLFFANILFSSEVGWYFSPDLSPPFIDRDSESIFLKPSLSPSYNVKERPVVFVFSDLSLAGAFSYPFLRIYRVGIDRVAELVFLLPCQAIDYGEELSDIVGALFVDRTLEEMCVS